MERFTNNGTVSEADPVTDEVKQGCELPPFVFNLMLNAMLFHVYREWRPTAPIIYMTGGHLLKCRHIWDPARLFATAVHDLHFADDYTINTDTESDIQRCLDLFASGCA
ncbi:hypothetical protein SprV_0802621500 [Sparganum proliferum]